MKLTDNSSMGTSLDQHYTGLKQVDNSCMETHTGLKLTDNSSMLKHTGLTLHWVEDSSMCISYHASYFCIYIYITYTSIFRVCAVSLASSVQHRSEWDAYTLKLEHITYFM